MAELGISELKLDDGSVVTIKEDCECAITERTREPALRWLAENGFSGLIKTQVVAVFGRGEREVALKAFEKLVDEPADVSLKEDVHASTLKAFVKEQISAGNALPLDLFNVIPFNKATRKRPRSARPGGDFRPGDCRTPNERRTKMTRKVLVPNLPTRFDAAVRDRVPSIDLNTATRFGDLVCATRDPIEPPMLGTAIAAVKAEVARMVEGDMVLITGDPVLSAAAIHFAALHFGENPVRVLRWDRQRSVYDELEVKL